VSFPIIRPGVAIILEKVGSTRRIQTCEPTSRNGVQIEVWFNFSRFVGHHHGREICLLRYARKNSLRLFSVLGQSTLTLRKSFAPNTPSRVCLLDYHHLTAVLTHEHGSDHDQTLYDHLRVMIYSKKIKPVVKDRYYQYPE
jgi:hypothetical protein